jgi:acetate kinase
MPRSNDAILVLNAGSSSIKLSVFAEDAGNLALELRGQIEGLYVRPVSRRRTSPDASSPRSRGRGRPSVTTGRSNTSASFSKTTWQVGGCAGWGIGSFTAAWSSPGRCESIPRRSRLSSASSRWRPCISRTTWRRWPDCSNALRSCPQVACFDTSFHRTNPDVAQRFALPSELHDAGVQRYGFHGLSYEYIASELPRLDPKAAAGRTIVLHLGNGASMCAIEAGRSVATTMGFTPADGLPMGTRCGALDPGVIVYLMDERRMDARAIEQLLYRESGLLGVSGVSSDMRTLLSSGQPSARLAIDIFVYRIRRRARLAGRRARRTRRHRLHRRDRRARAGDPRARVSRRGVARGRAQTRRPTRAAARASARPPAGSAHGSFRPTRAHDRATHTARAGKQVRSYGQ